MNPEGFCAGCQDSVAGSRVTWALGASEKATTRSLNILYHSLPARVAADLGLKFGPLRKIRKLSSEF